ncbi:MAG: energy-coupling factor transporter transmembrane component T [Gordonia sp. (in: high G+C Gram-positive bacteria)]|uniref:energy-coupling factor transporter transmembrane component T n=1 Tax=Gordonia sp. (in: high G+C Gram-positive bacteria) TaxID=84139 RepID=UPI0039E5EED2
MTAAVVARSGRSGLDPRTSVLLTVVTAAVVLGPGGMRFVPVAYALGLGLAFYDRARRRALALVVFVTAAWLLGWWVPARWPGAFTATLGLTGFYLLRYGAAAGIVAHLVVTTSPTGLAAAFNAWRVPRVVSVTLAVMLRFFATVAAEFSAVRDAMRLRGLTGVRGIVRHPVLTLERFTVPLIATSLRSSEDLAASATLRGMGSRRRATSLHPVRFGGADLVAVVAVAALTIVALALPPVLA